ncbi:MAG: peptidylprolyl isomerase [Cellvibrionaceae bacterium]
MLKSLTIALLCFCLPLSTYAGTLVRLTTSEGVIDVELEDEKSPASVKNFLNYADKYFYNGLIFHRVIKNFMIQTGGITFDYQRKEVGDPVKNESNNGLLNKAGTLAMARMPDPDSATSQFFINLTDNPHLDFKTATPSQNGKPASPERPGYTVFGKVIKGMDVIEKIGKTKTRRYFRFANLPRKAIYLEKVERIKPATDKSTVTNNTSSEENNSIKTITEKKS